MGGSTIPNLKIFVSFEFDKDGDLKNNFFEQAKDNSPHRVKNSSLNEAYPTDEWKERARSAIHECDLVIVLVGQDTHSSLGVKTEIDIVRQLKKPVFQVALHDEWELTRKNHFLHNESPQVQALTQPEAQTSQGGGLRMP